MIVFFFIPGGSLSCGIVTFHVGLFVASTVPRPTVSFSLSQASFRLVFGRSFVFPGMSVISSFSLCALHPFSSSAQTTAVVCRLTFMDACVTLVLQLTYCVTPVLVLIYCVTLVLPLIYAYDIIFLYYSTHTSQHLHVICLYPDFLSFYLLSLRSLLRMELLFIDLPLILH